MRLPEFVQKEMDAVKVWRQRIDLKRKYSGIFNTLEGREVLHDILRNAGFASNGMDPNPNMTAYNEGRRSVALHILSRMRMNDEEAALKLMEEGYER